MAERVVVVEPGEVHELASTPSTFRISTELKALCASPMAASISRAARSTLSRREVAAREHVAHRVEVGAERVHPLLDEAVGLHEVEAERRELLVDALELAP